MAKMARDAALYKSLLAGVLAASSGVVIYLGYRKWKDLSTKQATPLPDEKKPEEEKKPVESKQSETQDDVRSDPTPILQPISPTSTNANSTANNTSETLSMSATFEKVSLSAFQEPAKSTAQEDPEIQSPSESFEKLSLPTNSLSSGSGDLVETGSSSSPAAAVAEIQKPSPSPAASFSAPQSKDKKVTKMEIPISEPIKKAEAKTVETTVTLTLPDLKQGATKGNADPEPVSLDLTESVSAVIGDVRDDEGDAGDVEDEDEDESASEASNNSQVKDGSIQEDLLIPERVPTVATSRGEQLNLSRETLASGTRSESGYQTSQSTDLYPDKDSIHSGSDLSAKVLPDKITDSNSDKITEGKPYGATPSLSRHLGSTAGTGTSCRVFVGHPVEKTKWLDFGMTLCQDKPGHTVESVEKGGLAEECGINAGDELVSVNKMSVTRWKTSILLKLLTLINTEMFELTLSPSDKTLKSKHVIRQITISLTLDKELVKTKAIILDKPTDTEVAPPIELGTLTPKDCYIEKPETGNYLMAKDTKVILSKKAEDTGPFQMKRLLFTRVNIKGYQPPVTMLAFCQSDVTRYICTLNSDKLSLMYGDDADTKSLDVADCRFFSHKFVAGLDCFEATQFPDHYLSCEGEELVLKYISNPKQVGQDLSVLFKVHYKTTK